MEHDRKPLRLGISLGFAIAAAMFGGCSKQPNDALSVVVIGEGPLTLGDALSPAKSEAQEVLRLNIAQGLVRFDGEGEVEPGLAERWNVSDDGLSYIFRLAAGTWPDGRKIMAKDVARIIKRQLRAANTNSTRDALGAIEDVVAMTDRVIEIRLSAPRPYFLELLAHPDLALIREGVGSGPFRLREDDRPPGGESVAATSAQGVTPDNDSLPLTRRPMGPDGEPGAREDVLLAVGPVGPAIAAFQAGKIDLVLGGTLRDVPLVSRLRLPRNALRFDPASGLFGLVPVRKNNALAEPEVRRLLSEAIDRTALINALAIPGLGPRATVLQAGLAGVSDPRQPAWLAQPLAERREALEREAERLFGETERPRFRVALPDGPGGDLVFERLAADWGAIGIGIERVGIGAAADLAWVDRVAPSTSPAWFLRQFRCSLVPICLPEADTLLDEARAAPDAALRGKLLAEAAALMDENTLFIALAAPVRWSLVGDRAAGFQDNRFARHPLADIVGSTSRGFTP